MPDTGGGVVDPAGLRRGHRTAREKRDTARPESFVLGEPDAGSCEREAAGLRRGHQTAHVEPAAYLLRANAVGVDDQSELLDALQPGYAEDEAHDALGLGVERTKRCDALGLGVERTKRTMHSASVSRGRSARCTRPRCREDEARDALGPRWRWRCGRRVYHSTLAADSLVDSQSGEQSSVRLVCPGNRDHAPRFLGRGNAGKA